METNRGTCKTYITHMTHGNDVAEKGNSLKTQNINSRNRQINTFVIIWD